MDPMHALVDQSSKTATSKEINESGRQKSLLRHFWIHMLQGTYMLYQTILLVIVPGR